MDFDTDEPTPTRPLAYDEEPVFHRTQGTYSDPVAIPALRPAPPSAARVYEAIMAAAERQIATAAAARPIIDAGCERALHALVTQIAANAANPIADMLEDALADCSRGSR